MSISKASSAVDKWYTRTLFSVSNVRESLRHYCELLGFEQDWKFEEGGRAVVTQVHRGECELILTENLDHVGAGRVFVSLELEELGRLEKDLAAKQIPFERAHWGYPIIKVKDPDGNEMVFPLET